MKYLIVILFVAAVTSIIIGYTVTLGYSQKLIGTGVIGIFFIVFPLFSYYRWKGKDLKDYMLTKENLDKMRNHKQNHKV